MMQACSSECQTIPSIFALLLTWYPKHCTYVYNFYVFLVRLGEEWIIKLELFEGEEYYSVKKK